jgi:hypothetical protein
MDVEWSCKGFAGVGGREEARQAEWEIRGHDILPLSSAVGHHWKLRSAPGWCGALHVIVLRLRPASPGFPGWTSASVACEQWYFEVFLRYFRSRLYLIHFST